MRWSEKDLEAAGAGSDASRPAPRRPHRQLEYLEQCAFLEWCENQYVRIRIHDRSLELCIADHVVASLNGAFLAGTKKHRAMQWARQHKAGAKKNAPDLSIDIPFRGYHGMRMEMKRQRRDFRSPGDAARAVRQGQRDYLHTLERLGYFTAIPYGWLDAAIYVCEYFEWDPRAKGLC